MKRVLLLTLLMILTFFLSSCSYMRQENFIYFDGYRDEEVKYFDEYAIVYEDDEYNLTLYALRDMKITDTEGKLYVNYLLEWDVSKLTEVSLTCGNHVLKGGSRGWSPGGMDSHLIPGEEIYDYCGDYSKFSLELPGEEVILIDIFRSDNSGDISWSDVSEINENNFSIFFRDNQTAILYVSIAFVTAILMGVTYIYIYKRNYNNFTKGRKVRKLLSIGVVNIILVTLFILSSIIIIQENESLINRYDSNFYDYEQQENSVYYLSEFDNENFQLIGSKGNQEVYIESASDDEITFYFVLVDGDSRYYMDAFMWSFPNAAVYDSIRVDLYQKEVDYGGLIFGNVIALYEIIDGVSIQTGSLSLGVTESVDGETIFVDYMDSTGSWQVYYENNKGYYMMNYLNGWYLGENE